MQDARAVLEQWLDAIEEKDVDRILDLLADDVSMETETLRTPITGKDLLHGMLAESMDALGDIEIERRKIIASGNEAAVLVDMHVTYADDLEMWGETIPAGGRRLDLTGALFVEVNDEGRISRIMRVRDTLGVVQQLGISPDQIGRLMAKAEEYLGAAGRAGR